MHTQKLCLPPDAIRFHFRKPLLLTALSALLFFASSCAMPIKKPAYLESGVASWYGEQFHGRPTASGEIFNMNRLTAAHRTLPLGTKAKVTNLENNKTVKVVITDRGPFVDGRTIDLSKAAARKIGMETQGLAKVKIEAPPTKESPAPSGEAHRQNYTVQVGSFADRKHANGLLEKLGNWRSDGYVVEYKTNKGTLYRVRVGSFNSIEKAEAAAKDLKKQGYPTFVAAR